MTEPLTTATLKPGTKLASTGSAVQVVVVRPPAGPVVLTCSGAPMVGLDGSAGGDAVASEEQVLLGKRYVDEASGLEVLCTQPGPGVLAADARPLTVKGAKALPSSD
jgi:hypothetical protein